MTGKGRVVHCYILLGDPTWLQESVSSYYCLVDKIVGVYDQNGLSWSGVDISNRIQTCREILESIDIDHKVEFLSQDFLAHDQSLMKAETNMRNAGIECARQRAQLILQLDTDEIVPDVKVFSECLDDWYESDADGLEFAARWLYVHIFGSFYLERSTRRLTYWDAIPGCIAIRPHITVSFARQIKGAVQRFTPLQPHCNLSIEKAILHPSMIQKKQDMEFKLLKLSGHSKEMNMKSRLTHWYCARIVPILYVFWSVLFPSNGTYRVVSLKYCSILVENTRKYYHKVN
jgi:hypothetical protein